MEFIKLQHNLNVSICPPDVSINDALHKLDKSGTGILILCDINRIIKGVVTDGNIRRAILKGINFQNPIISICTKDFVKAQFPITKEEAIELMDCCRPFSINHLPLIDENEKVIALLLRRDLNTKEIAKNKKNIIVIMAGGLGTRLMPLTKDCPKPMLEVGNKPILETMIESIISQDFKNIYISVNYKSKIIVDYFGDGQAWNVDIKYILENKRMGTAGALGLLPVKPKRTIDCNERRFINEN